MPLLHSTYIVETLQPVFAASTIPNYSTRISTPRSLTTPIQIYHQVLPIAERAEHPPHARSLHVPQHHHLFTSALFHHLDPHLHKVILHSTVTRCPTRPTHRGPWRAHETVAWTTLYSGYILIPSPWFYPARLRFVPECARPRVLAKYSETASQWSILASRWSWFFAMSDVMCL
jgi:hypothetical protein